jgi:hypothetical protein
VKEREYDLATRVITEKVIIKIEEMDIIPAVIHMWLIDNQQKCQTGLMPELLAGIG